MLKVNMQDNNKAFRHLPSVLLTDFCHALSKKKYGLIINNLLKWTVSQRKPTHLQRLNKLH